MGNLLIRTKSFIVSMTFLAAAFSSPAVPDDADITEIDRLVQHAETIDPDDDLRGYIDTLENALSLSGKSNRYYRHAFISGNLAGAYLQAGEPVKAERVLQSAIGKVNTDGAKRTFLPQLHNDLGRLYMRSGDAARAMLHFRKAVQLAADGDNRELEIGGIFNLLLLQPRNPLDERVDLYRRALRSAAGLPDEGIKGELLLRLGILSLADFDATQSKTLAGLSIRLLDAATAALSDKHHPISLYEAWGRAGEAHALSGDYSTAATYYRRAIKGSLRQNNLEQLYRWYWGLGRIQSHDDGTLPEALQYYELAVNTHQDLFIGTADSTNLGDRAELYNEFLSLLLDGADPDKAAFERAIKTIEGLRTAAIQDYFQDSCVAEARLHVGSIIETIDADTAIIYPLILNDRLRVLLVTRDGVRQSISGLSHSDLVAATEGLRRHIQDNDNAYLVQSRLLSAALVKPFEGILERRQVSHLIVVPDHLTAAIPYAALEYNGRFLLEHFSVSIAPSLQLTRTDPAATRRGRALYAGVSLPVSNLPALQHVRDEIVLASSFIPGETLLNTGFSTENIAERLVSGGYSIVHLASHSNIADEVEDSFILTFDGKMTLNNLRDLLGGARYSQSPVQLLSLSACNTAEGSRRAALGLAGLAVKSGARSVLASLWPINDAATARLVAEFYRALADGRSKADALRGAQQSLLGDERFGHPNNWAAFVLIGDWH